MIVTEKEARSMRCVRMAAAIATLPDIQKKNAAILSDGQCCVGSKCMSWRWGWAEPSEGKEQRCGFCGEAGKP